MIWNKIYVIIEENVLNYNRLDVWVLVNYL